MKDQILENTLFLVESLWLIVTGNLFQSLVLYGEDKDWFLRFLTITKNISSVQLASNWAIISAFFEGGNIVNLKIWKYSL